MEQFNNMLVIAVPSNWIEGVKILLTVVELSSFSGEYLNWLEFSPQGTEKEIEYLLRARQRRNIAAIRSAGKKHGDLHAHYSDQV